MTFVVVVVVVAVATTGRMEFPRVTEPPLVQIDAINSTPFRGNQ